MITHQLYKALKRGMINIEQGSISFGLLLLHHLLELLELLHLLHLQQLHRVHSRWEAVGNLGKLSSGDLSLCLHVLTGFGTDDAKFLHEFDDRSLHFSENGHDFGVSHDDVVSDVLHEVFLLKAIFFEDEVVEREGEQHGDELEIFRSAFETGEEILEESDFVVQFADLVF
jgi:hypothetical protein